MLFILQVSILSEQKIYPYMKRPSTNATMKEHLSDTKPIRLIATHVNTMHYTVHGGETLNRKLNST